MSKLVNHDARCPVVGDQDPIGSVIRARVWSEPDLYFLPVYQSSPYESLEGLDAPPNIFILRYGGRAGEVSRVNRSGFVRVKGSSYQLRNRLIRRQGAHFILKLLPSLGIGFSTEFFELRLSDRLDIEGR